MSTRIIQLDRQFGIPHLYRKMHEDLTGFVTTLAPLMLTVLLF